MKKNYFKFLVLLVFAFTSKVNAQCSSCTTTITGADATNYIVASGPVIVVVQELHCAFTFDVKANTSSTNNLK